MSADPRAVCASMTDSSQKERCACPVEGSSLCQHMRTFAFVLVTIQRRTGLWRYQNSAIEVQYHCEISNRTKPHASFADLSAQFHSPTSFTHLGVDLVCFVHICLLATLSRFALVLSIFHVSSPAAAITTCSSASSCATPNSARLIWSASRSQSD